MRMRPAELLELPSVVSPQYMFVPLTETAAIGRAGLGFQFASTVPLLPVFSLARLVTALWPPIVLNEPPTKRFVPETARVRTMPLGAGLQAETAVPEPSALA